MLYDPATLDWADGIAHDALICSRTEDRPRALAAIERPPPSPRPFAIRADSLVQIRFSDAGEPCQSVKRFLAALGDSDG